MSRTASYKQDLLEKLGKSLVISNDKFIPFGGKFVYSEPLKSSKQISFDGRDYVNGKGVVVNLDYVQQLGLLYGGEHGLKLRHGTLKETVDAAWSKETKAYKENVLEPYWVYNREVLKKVGRAYDVSMSEGVEHRKLTSPKLDDIMIERGGKIVGIENAQEKEVPVIKVGEALQRLVPATGFYTGFSGAVPIKKELGEKKARSRGYFGSVYTSFGISTVRSNWFSNDGVLFADAVRPLYWGSDGVLGAWTDENPKK